MDYSLKAFAGIVLSKHLFAYRGDIGNAFFIIVQRNIFHVLSRRAQQMGQLFLR